MDFEAAEPVAAQMIASDDDSLSADEQKEIEGARIAVEKSPTFDAYKNLISVLRKRGNDVVPIRNTRNAFAKAFPLPASNWIEWADDELIIASTADERRFVARDILQRGLGDYISMSLSKKLLLLQIERFRAKECPADEVRATFQDLKLKGAAMHFLDGAELWQIYFQFLSEAEVSDGEKQEFMLEMAKLPLKRVDEEYMDVTDGVSKLSSLSNIQRSSEVEDLITSCGVFESKITDLNADSSAESGMGSEDLKMRYAAYASYLAELNSSAAKSVWERCIQECFLDDSIWRQYARFCRNHRSISEENSALERTVRNVPWDLSAWRALICNITRRSEKNVIAMEAATAELVAVLGAVHPHVYSSTDWDGAMHLSIAALMCYSRLQGAKEAKEAAFATVQYSEEGSVQWGHCKFAMAAVCVGEDDISGAIEHVEDVIAKRSAELRWWQRYTHLLLRAKVSDGEIRDVFRRGVRLLETKDDVETFGSCWIEFEALATDGRNGYENVQEEVENRLAILPKAASPAPRPTPRHNRPLSEKATESKGHIPASLRKRKKPESKKRQKGRSGPGKEGSASEEKQSNIAVRVSTGKSTPADPASAKPEGTTTTEEKTANASVEYEPNTVFINNLPFKATEEDLREKFEKVGEIKGIRIPKRGDGAAKGIGYIEFADATATESALALHNTPVLGRAIWVRRSKPPRNSGTSAKSRRQAKRKKHTTGHKPRLDLNIGTGVAEGGSAEKSRDGDTQMTDATAAEAVTAEDTEEKSKTQDDFRALLLGKKS